VKESVGPSTSVVKTVGVTAILLWPHSQKSTSFVDVCSTSSEIGVCQLESLHLDCCLLWLTFIWSSMTRSRNAGT
jgi:hypothetical protein